MVNRCYERMASVAAGLATACWILAPMAVVAGNKKNGEHHTHGKVVSVTAPVNGVASITIEKHKHNKKNAAAAAQPQVVQKTFQITANTKFLVVSKKGTTVATIAAIHPGEKVKIESKHHVAETVAIVHHKHHKKNNAAGNGAGNAAAPVAGNAPNAPQPPGPATDSSGSGG